MRGDALEPPREGPLDAKQGSVKVNGYAYAAAGVALVNGPKNGPPIHAKHFDSSVGE